MGQLISEKIISLLNYRIKQEEQSSRLYKSMSVWLGYMGYEGSAKLWDKYSLEELDHAGWVYKYMLDLNINPVVPNQDEPKRDFKSLQQIIALSYEHELGITWQCKELSKMCLSEGDLMTFTLAQKFMEEQIGEIQKTQLLLDKLEQFGDTPIALKLLDTELGNI